MLGTRPPHLSSADFFAPLVELTGEDLLAALTDLGVVNPLLRDSPMRRLFLPGLRADLRLIAGYRLATRAALPFDLHAWHATGDPLAPPAPGPAWRRYTTSRFEHATFEGDHFFPVSCAETIIARLLALGGD